MEEIALALSSTCPLGQQMQSRVSGEGLTSCSSWSGVSLRGERRALVPFETGRIEVTGDEAGRQQVELHIQFSCEYAKYTHLAADVGRPVVQ